MERCAGGFLLDGDRVLLGKRSAERELYPGVWDTIGGHCRPGETPEETLARELREEIDVTPERFTKLAVLMEPRPDLHGELEYHMYAITAWSGPGPVALGDEHEEIRWVPIDEIDQVNHAHPATPELIATVRERLATESDRTA